MINLNKCLYSKKSEMERIINKVREKMCLNTRTGGGELLKAQCASVFYVSILWAHLTQ